MYVGVVAVVFGASKFHADVVGDYDFTNSFRFVWAIAYIAMLCLAAYGLGLPEVPRTVRSRAATSLGASAVAALGISSVQLVAGDALLPRLVVFGSAAALVPWFFAVASLAGAGRSTLEERDRVVVVGPASLAAEIVDELNGNPEKPASVVGTLTEDQAGAIDDRRRPLTEAVVENRASVLVLSAAAQADERIVDQAAALHESGVRVRTQSLFYEQWLGKIPVADLGRVALFFDIGEVHRERFGRVKRLVDVAAGVVGCVALVVVLPLVAIGDVLANRGPLYYTQQRVGRAGHRFTIYKFRTMQPSSGGSADWTKQDDPRITPFGRFLRVSHLDELPQVLNIVRGDLSLVGPRPEQPHYVAELVEKLPYYDLRHIVRPGLTGWAQVKYGYAGDERDALEKLQYDFHYLRRQSILFDLRIVGRTTRSILGIQGRGR